MKWLRAFSVLVDLIAEAVSYFKRRKAEQRQEERRDAHEQIDADLDGALRDLDWVQSDSTRRDDGAPRDYDVSGPSKTLDRE